MCCHKKGANAEFSPEDIDIDSLSCDIFHIGYVLLLDKFDEEDWACYETFTTGEDLYIWTEEGSWEKALETAMDNLKAYLNNGRYSSILLKYNGVGIGFVDGDVEIIYRR